MASNRQSLLVLHSAVLLFAVSGLFAKWLTLAPSVIVFGRSFFAVLTLATFIVLIKKQSLKITAKHLLAMVLTGAVLALHWLTFFQAIQVSTVAIALITFATFPVMVSIIEPLFFQERFRGLVLVQALLTVIGIALVLPLENLSSAYAEGALLGVFSAFLFAVLTLLNRKYVRQTSAKQVAFYQNFFASMVLLPWLMMCEVTLSFEQVSLLILLGVVFTALAHTLFNFALKRLKAASASVAVSLEPIYGILAAYILLGEPLSLVMVLGGTLVIATNIWAAKTAH